MGVATAERSPALPDMPTIREQGFPDFLMTAWYGLYFKAGTNPQMVSAMRDVIRKAGETQVVKDSLKTFVHDPLHLVGDEVTAMNLRELETWTKLVRDHGIKFTD